MFKQPSEFTVRSIPLPDLLTQIGESLSQWAGSNGGKLYLAESPAAAWTMLQSGLPAGGFAAALYFEGDRAAADDDGFGETVGTLSVAILRHPGMAAKKLESHLKSAVNRPALLLLVDSLRQHIHQELFAALPNHTLEYQSCRYLQLQDGALVNGYALTWQFTYFHVADVADMPDVAGESEK